MDLAHHWRMMARYNRLANERLYECCALLSDVGRRQQRTVSFGSIHALLNHILLGDRIWMARFEGGGATTPPLDTVLYDDFFELRAARVEEDQRIETFFADAEPAFVSAELKYTNSRGVACVDQAGMAAAHFFNHQTHHRGQVHVMLTAAGIAAPSLDLHRLINP
ncbi:MAG TPA: DinB family protein [Bryobacteraceae bacterium]|nr:DinB family protein [Bryobacteraceae bacterium]